MVSLRPRWRVPDEDAFSIEKRSGLKSWWPTPTHHCRAHSRLLEFFGYLLARHVSIATENPRRLWGSLRLEEKICEVSNVWVRSILSPCLSTVISANFLRDGVDVLAVAASLVQSKRVSGTHNKQNQFDERCWSGKHWALQDMSLR